MNIIQTFYDKLASEYDKLFSDWKAATDEQAEILKRIFEKHGFEKDAHILDCACGIGTQAIGLASLGYNVTASDISEGALSEARKRAAEAKLNIQFENADFCNLSDSFKEQFDIVIAMDNALSHMLSSEMMKKAVFSITDRIKPQGIFVGSIRDYDALLKTKPPYSPAYINKKEKGQRVCFQTWGWYGDNYKLTQYIIDDGEKLNTSKFECEYRAVKRDELTNLFLLAGCKDVTWLFPDDTGFYQPIIVAVR